MAAGQTLLTLYDGGAFGLSCVLGAASTLMFSGAIFRHPLLDRLAGTIRVVTGGAAPPAALDGLIVPMAGVAHVVPSRRVIRASGTDGTLARRRARPRAAGLAGPVRARHSRGVASR